MSGAHAVHHPVFARIYIRLARHEPAEQVERRRELLAGLAGTVVEVGAGSGANFAHYPPTVERVVAVEPEPLLRDAARQAAAAAPVAIEVVDGLAERLPLDDASADAGIASLVLCSVRDQAVALGELRRVIRPGGELRFFEHVVAQDARFARLQRGCDRVLWPRVAGGCHAARDTPAAIAAAGFEIERCERLSVRPCLLALPVTPHVIGVARR